MAALLAAWAAWVGAQEAAPAAGVPGQATRNPPESIVIIGRGPTDEELTRLVEAVLVEDPYLDSTRVTVTTKDGVVTLEGLVGDWGDVLRAIRISGRVAGVKRLVDDLETYEPDGFGM